MLDALRRGRDAESSLVAVLTGYFDAAGHPKQGNVLVVGGFISFEPRWCEFERLWTTALQKAGIQQFHMTDFINNSHQFKGWEKRSSDKRRLLTELIKVVVKTVVLSFASVVILDDWRRANKDYALAERDFLPYSIAGWSCVERVRGWCDDHLYKYPLFVFEFGDTHQDSLVRCVERDFGIVIQTEKKKDVIELQSADFAAWQLLNLMRDHEAGKIVQQSIEPWLWKAFSQLFLQVKYTHTHFSLQDNHPWYRERFRAPSLIDFCQRQNIPKRKI